MAYLVSTPQDAEEQSFQGVIPLSAGSTGAPAGGPNGSPMATPTGGTSAPSSSGAFVNLQRYLSANVPQAQQLAERVAGNVGEETTQAQQAIDTAGTTIGQQIASGTVNYNKELVDQAIAAPTNVTGTTADALGKLTGGMYGGPASARETGLLTAADKELGDLSNIQQLAKTAGGRQELISKLPGSQPYARGGLSLDQLLLQNVDPARERFQQSVEQTRPLAQTYTERQQQLADQIAAAKQTSSATGERVRGELTGAATGVQEQIEQSVAQQRANYEAKQRQAQSALQTGGSVGDDVLNTLGMTRDQWNNLVNLNEQAAAYTGIPDAASRGVASAGGVNLADYLTMISPDAAITARTAATPEQAARYQALMRLAGQQGSYISPEQLQAQQDFARFDIAGASQAAQDIIQSGKAREQQRAANAQLIAQQEAAAAAQAKAAKKAQTTSTIGAVASVALAVFCYTKDTPILMADDTWKPVQDVAIGDEVALGGLVTGVSCMLTDNLYSYKETLVTGTHAVFEDGVWIRVRDSKLATEIDLGESLVPVFPLITLNHLTVTSTHIGADVIETTDYEELTNSGRIDLLNSQTERNKMLAAVDADLYGTKVEQLEEVA